MLILAGAIGDLPSPAPVGTATASAAQATPSTDYRPPTPVPVRTASQAPRSNCQSQDISDITVCAQRPQGYRLDPNVVDAERQADRARASASAALPPAQASCARSPMGCGTGLEGLDLANVAIVLGTTAVKAAEGQDWQGIFKKGGSNEYQLYLEAKEQREARKLEAQAAAVKAEANRQEATRIPRNP